jgi:hypothetical protein
VEDEIMVTFVEQPNKVPHLDDIRMTLVEPGLATHIKRRSSYQSYNVIKSKTKREDTNRTRLAVSDQICPSLWETRLLKLKLSKTWADLARTAEELKMEFKNETKDNEWGANCHLTFDNKCLPSSDILKQVRSPFEHSDATAFPIRTVADGGWFYHAAGRLAYGDHDHGIAMRVRLVVEGCLNKELYTDHKYLTKLIEYKPTVKSDKDICSQLIRDAGCVSWPHEKLSQAQEDRYTQRKDVIRLSYEKLITDMTDKAKFAGLWQFYLLANVIKHPVRSFYPSQKSSRHGVMEDHYQLYDRIIYPVAEDACQREAVVIMWTMRMPTATSFDHFVRLVR